MCSDRLLQLATLLEEGAKSNAPRQVREFRLQEREGQLTPENAVM